MRNRPKTNLVYMTITRNTVTSTQGQDIVEVTNDIVCIMNEMSSRAFANKMPVNPPKVKRSMKPSTKSNPVSIQVKRDRTKSRP